MQSLNLYGLNRTSDTSLEHLRGMKQLQKLVLTYCRRLSDAGLRNLAGLQLLRGSGELSTGGTAITDAGLAAFREANPAS
jgi:hypothetical protein